MRLSKISWGKMAEIALSRPAFIPARGIASSAIVLKKAEKSTVDLGLPSSVEGKRNFPSAYSLYLKEFAADHSNIVRNSAGKVDIGRLVKSAFSAWSSIPDTDKEPYVKKAEAIRDEIIRERSQFWRNLSAEKKEEVRKSLGKEGTRVFERAHKLALREREGNPGRLQSAWFAFLRDVRPEIESAYERGELDDKGGKGDRLSLLAVTKEAAKRYKELSEAEKERYQAIYKESAAKYVAWLKTQKDL